MSSWDHEIDEFEDVIDTRNVEDRIEELQNRKDDPDQSEPLTVDECSELASLLILRTEIYPEFGEAVKDGITLIRFSYFSDYIQEEAMEVSDNPNAYKEWPLNHIDWEEAANEARYDYSEFEWNGVTYLGRE